MGKPTRDQNFAYLCSGTGSWYGPAVTRSANVLYVSSRIE